MPDVTLQHCVPVTIPLPLPLPPAFSLIITVGGGPHDGVVDVTAGPGELPGTVSLPTGSSATCPCLGVTTLQLHFKKSPVGPADVETTYGFDVS